MKSQGKHVLSYKQEVAVIIVGLCEREERGPEIK